MNVCGKPPVVLRASVSAPKLQIESLSTATTRTTDCPQHMDSTCRYKSISCSYIYTYDSQQYQRRTPRPFNASFINLSAAGGSALS